MQKEILIGIVTSIAATLIINYSSSAFTRLRKWIVNKVSEFSRSYSNSIYTTAAKSDKQNSFHTVGNIILFVIFVSSGLLIAWVVEPIVTNEDGLIINPPATLEEAKTLLTMLTYALIFLLILLIAPLIFYFTQHSKALYIHDLIIQFEQEMTMLRPFIGESEYQKIYSKWASMKCREDYNALADMVNALLKKHFPETVV